VYNITYASEISVIGFYDGYGDLRSDLCGAARAQAHSLAASDSLHLLFKAWHCCWSCMFVVQIYVCFVLFDCCCRSFFWFVCFQWSTLLQFCFDCDFLSICFFVDTSLCKSTHRTNSNLPTTARTSNQLKTKNQNYNNNNKQYLWFQNRFLFRLFFICFSKQFR
jgi:hypothetical protein